MFPRIFFSEFTSALFFKLKCLQFYFVHRYFSQLAPLLDEDKTLFCISAWNDYSYQHASANASLMYSIQQSFSHRL